jgi:hypothetical protein
MIGFAPRGGFRPKDANFQTCGWFISVASGTLYAQDRTWDKAYGAAIPEGSIVTAIHDTRQHTIEFQVDGTSLGTAYRNISHDTLYAAADFYDHATIRIMDNP